MEVITDYGTFLREAREAVQELERLQNRETELVKKQKLDKKALETEKKLEAKLPTAEGWLHACITPEQTCYEME